MRLQHPSRGRRGSILIVVVGLLALFAVVGLSFVLYADAEATAARSARAARNDDTLPDPNVAANVPANDFLEQFIFGTNDSTSALRGHDLLTSRFELNSNVPFTGTGLPVGTTSINYTGTATVPTNKAVPWTYPDLNNYYLAWLDPTTGKVTVPSFHRDGVFGSLAPGNPNWTDPTAKTKTLRPIPGSTAQPLHPNFPRVPANPDGTYTGDVCNLRFMTGSQTNDSLWMYTGSPVQTWRGRQYVAMVAPLVLDLSGRVNLSVAGNTNGASIHGFGPWEINPVPVGVNQADVGQLIAARQNNGAIPGDRHGAGTMGQLNRGRNSSNPNEIRRTPFYSRFDADGLITTSGPPTLPAAASTVPFPTYPARFEDSDAAMTAALTNHPSMFNPFQFGRGAGVAPAHGFGMDDLVKLASRYNDPKNRYNSAEIATKAPTSLANADARTLTTAFSVSQRWGRLPVNGGAAFVGPVDLNRPLPEYRTDVTKPLSSTNIVTGAQLTAADNARQNLAMDIFVRLLAAANLVNGTNVTYASNTGRVTFAGAPTATMKQFAQFAVNVVDYIDGDDIMTRFRWHDDTNVVYGTELPKLVLNEAYSAMFNHNDDSAPPIFPMMPMNMKRPAQKPVKKKFWVELHNPLMSDATLPDSSAARLFDTNGNINCYELVIGEDAGANGTSYSTYLQTPENASEPNLGGTINIKIRINQFNNGTANATLGAAERYLVQPTDGATAVANGNKGYYVVGPPDRTTNPPTAAATTFPDKQGAALTYSFVPTGGLNSMEYDATPANVGPTDQNIIDEKAKKHTVILRRLANPYIATAVGTNPFVTVDVVEAVPTNDRVEYNKDDKRAAPGNDAQGSIGKRHPYATGYYGDPAAVKALDLQTGATTPPHTFFLKNSNLDNATTGLAWLVHLDRELVNATEILQTSIFSPGELTRRFFNGALPAGTTYNRHNRSTNGILGNLLDPTFLANGFKAFDVLTVASRLPGVPLGGREPGLVNINTINDQRVWNAVLDPQAGNTFTGATAPWSTVSASRGPAIPTINDRPFKPFATGATIEDTLLRSGPALFNVASTHDYFKPEPLRKVMNNLTTVTDGFLVIWTVGFFEVENATGPIIGKELFERVPGDLRSQYVAVVDRSTATVATAGTAATTAPFTKPWESKLTEDATTASNKITMQGTAAGIYVDGAVVPIGSQIRLGYGDATSGGGEWVTVASAVASTTPGQVTVTLSAAPTRYHGAGTRVSNALLGNPGPQATFDCTAPANRHIVPYYIRMQP